MLGGMPQPDVPPALRALFEAGMALVRRSSAAAVPLAKLASVVDPEMLPPEVRDAVREELDAAVARACVPIPFADVEKALRDAWDERPAKVFDALEETPLAVRPGAQVHAATLEGEPVVVKVRRPGLEGRVRGDLALVDALQLPLGAAFPQLDAGGMLREVRRMALDELDLEHEAATQRTVGRALRRVEGVRVPRPVTTWCAPGVLVAERLEGPTLAQAGAGAAPAGTAATLLRAHAAAARAGHVLLDPHPGHVVLLPDGELGLLGAGVTAPLERDRLDAALDALEALRGADEAAFATAVGDRGLGVLGKEPAGAAFALLRHLGAALLAGPRRLDAPYLGAVAEEAARQVGPLFRVAMRATPHPEDLGPARGLGQLAALLARLGEEEDWPALALDAARGDGDA
jgi:ubiquinone biosynthesis protein